MTIEKSKPKLKSQPQPPAAPTTSVTPKPSKEEIRAKIKAEAAEKAELTQLLKRRLPVGSTLIRDYGAHTEELGTVLGIRISLGVCIDYQNEAGSKLKVHCNSTDVGVMYKAKLQG